MPSKFYTEITSLVKEAVKNPLPKTIRITKIIINDPTTKEVPDGEITVKLELTKFKGERV